MRKIPSTMATQHPDNAAAPYWERDGDGFVSSLEEVEESMSSFRDLGAEEFMWDWEGRHADEAVIDKFFYGYRDFFKRRQLGKDVFLTFRLPNIWHEKGYGLLRALLVILTSEDFARDLKFHYPPLFEVILPLTERAEQLIYIERSFRKLARFKSQAFDHFSYRNNEHLQVIPLLEGIEHQIGVGKLLREYVRMHARYFRARPRSLRVFLARSDPALVSGLPATMIANKIALSEMRSFTKETGIPVFPIIGVGSLVFRGGLSPASCKEFIKEYAGVKTVTIQSAFRYDYPLLQVKRAIAYLNRHLPATRARVIPPNEIQKLHKLAKKFETAYQTTLAGVIRDVEPLFGAVPARRERRLHVGFLAYQRRMGALSLPRAINFTAAFYSLGIPPEFIGTGVTLKRLTDKERSLLEKYYVNIKSNLIEAGKYLNKENVKKLAQHNRNWNKIMEDIVQIEKIFGVILGPQTAREKKHYQLAKRLLPLLRNRKKATFLITASGILRRSLG
ncbi:MAG: phosphoenolpyruvate carboxylase [Patescibacteria group bacterium]